MPTVLKKFLVSLILSLFVLQSFTKPLLAQNPWYNQSYGEWHAKVTGGDQNEVFGERYTAAQVQWVVYGLAMFLIDNTTGQGVSNCLFTSTDETVAGCVQDVFAHIAISQPKNQLAQERQGESLLSAVFAERPISSVTYFKDIGRRLNLVPEAHAQTGFGFTALNPILNMWKVSRDITYLFFIVVIVIMAFMIMFRMKISPQTVITVQSSLPKIAVGLVLVTFSYAIAGLLIDLMYVAIGIVAIFWDMYSNAYNIDMMTPTMAFNWLTRAQPINQDVPALGNINLGIWGLMIIYLIIFIITALVVLILVLGALGLVITISVGGAAASAIGSTGLGGILILGVAIILFFTLILMLFRASFMLLKAYATILLLTVFAPFQILMGLIVPGGGFTSWLKSYITQLATFVVTGLLFMLSFLFLHQAVLSTWGSGGLNVIVSAIIGQWGQDFVITGDNSWPPLIGSSTAFASLGFLAASFSVFAIIPRTNRMVEAFMRGQEFNYGSAIGEAFGPAKWLGQQAQMAGSAYTGAYIYDPTALAGKYPRLTRIANQLKGIPKPIREAVARGLGYKP